VTTNDDETKVELHYGDKVVTVKERFDKIEKTQLLQSIGILLLLGVHLPEVGPILIAASKFL
jgi:hypothetical protein